MTAQEFNAIYESHALFLLRATQIAFRLTREQAEDIIQDVFQGVWNRGNVDGITDIRSYLFVCCRSCFCKQRLKEKKITKAVHDFYFLEVGASDVQDSATALMKAINGLPPQQRKIMEYKLHGMCWKDIAMVMGLSPSTVNNQIVVASKTLKRMFKPQTKYDN